MMNTVYIGYDPIEQEAYEVMVHSIDKHTKQGCGINIVPLIRSKLEKEGLYSRKYVNKDGQRYDIIDGRPFSTQFSFSRFLTPHIHKKGWALYMDCDMYLRADLNELFEEYSNDSKALMVIKHDYSPTSSRKMDNQVQENYNRKNWSSVMLFNCDHPANSKLTVADVNEKDGRWLHNFGWLEDNEIGEIHEEWNWLDSWSSATIDAKNVHFTTGGPMFSDWTGRGAADVVYANEWVQLNKEMREKYA
tara:strand:+ start:16071 stop:16811 length:741 start_codon:yes stop_codon:yes gene_type:complete